MESENSQKAGRRRSSRGVRRKESEVLSSGRPVTWVFLLQGLNSLRLTGWKTVGDNG